MPMAHAYNPSYSGDRDQEDCSSKPPWVNSSQDPIWKKNLSQKKAGRVAQGVGLEFKPQYLKNKGGEKAFLLMCPLPRRSILTLHCHWLELGYMPTP
jgi:hypothetical protein